MARLGLLLAAAGVLTIASGAAAVYAQSTATVVMQEFSFTPSRMVVSAGRDTFALQNTGRFPHNVHIEGATIGDGCLIASGSVVLNGSVIEDGAVLGAGGVVSFNGHIPARAMALGVPAKIREGYVVPEQMTAGIAEMYVANIGEYRAKLRRLD